MCVCVHVHVCVRTCVCVCVEGGREGLWESRKSSHINASMSTDNRYVPLDFLMCMCMSLSLWGGLAGLSYLVCYQVGDV